MTKPECHKDALGLMHHLGGFSQWALDTRHTIDEVLVPGYFNPVRTHRVRSGDWIFANCASPDGSTFEPCILVVMVGCDTALPGGAKADIEVVVLARPRLATAQAVAA